MSRRQFLGYGLGTGAALALPWTPGARAASAAAGGKLAKYQQALPLPGHGIVVAAPTSPNSPTQYSFTQTQIFRQLHPQLPPTPVWAYDDGTGLSGQAGSFGMVVVAESGTPVRASFTNDLPGTYPDRIPVDTRLTVKPDKTVRVMTHLHGGFVAADSDGNPTVTPDGFFRGGPNGATQNVYYTNQLPRMPPALLWFHDHGLGTTRLNVFAGLAAAYILRDGNDTGAEPNPIGIPGGAVRDTAGHSGPPVQPGRDLPLPGQRHPRRDLDRRVLRRRHARQRQGLAVPECGAAPVPVPDPERLQRADREPAPAPAERADVIADFRPSAGQTLVMKNSKPTKPVSTPAPSLEQVMQIRVGMTVTQPGPDTVPASLPGRAANVTGPVAATRFITLNEVAPETANWTLNLNGVDFEAPGPAETPRAGTVEEWVYINLTPDTHPMHTHLVTHQVIGRTPFDAAAYQARYGGPDGVPGGIDPTPFATGPMAPADPAERGFKDTTKVNPGYFTTIRALFELPAGVTAPQAYVHHCHIVEHEDNDMMRPYIVEP